MKTYLWGTDLSGSFQGAGGVGGLLAIKDWKTNKTYAILNDGRGNVTGLVDASSGEQVAKYAYGPFGESVMAVGEAREVCPFRFSTKYFDKATGLHYYGYRYYSASMGRWLNRDPIGEEGGVNVYGFVGNDPVNKWDVLGLAICANKCSQGDRRIVNRDYRIVPNGVAWNAPDSVSALAAGIGALTNTVDLTNILSLSRSATSALASKALEKVEGAVIDATAATAPGNDAESIINNAAQRAFGAGEASRGINVYTVIEYQSCQQESCLIFCKRWNWPEKSTVSVRKCLGGQLLGGTTFISRNISNHVLAKCMAEHVKELNSKNE